MIPAMYQLPTDFDLKWDLATIERERKVNVRDRPYEGQLGADALEKCKTPPYGNVLTSMFGQIRFIQAQKMYARVSWEAYAATLTQDLPGLTRLCFRHVLVCREGSTSGFGWHPANLLPGLYMDVVHNAGPGCVRRFVYADDVIRRYCEPEGWHAIFYTADPKYPLPWCGLETSGSFRYCRSVVLAGLKTLPEDFPWTKIA